jgi:hypothetical protein
VLAIRLQNTPIFPRAGRPIRRSRGRNLETRAPTVRICTIRQAAPSTRRAASSWEENNVQSIPQRCRRRAVWCTEVHKMPSKLPCCRRSRRCTSFGNSLSHLYCLCVPVPRRARPAVLVMQVPALAGRRRRRAMRQPAPHAARSGPTAPGTLPGRSAMTRIATARCKTARPRCRLCATPDAAAARTCTPAWPSPQVAERPAPQLTPSPQGIARWRAQVAGRGVSARSFHRRGGQAAGPR